MFLSGYVQDMVVMMHSKLPDEVVGWLMDERM